MVFSLLGRYNIQCEIDNRKTNFLQKLCKMPTNCLTNQMFTYCLNCFKTVQCTRQKCFISDTFNILQTYGLTAYIVCALVSNYWHIP